MGADIINGDRAILDVEKDGVVAYGSPYAGSSGIYRNEFCKVRAIIFLSQEPENRIRKLSPAEAYKVLFPRFSMVRWDVDEKKELRDAIDEDDISEYELNKYFYTDDKARNKIYYFAEEDAAADCLEENLLSNSYYEKAGMFDKDGFAIDGEGTLLAYNGKAEEITIPQNVKRIAENAMSADYDRALDTKKVTILGNVKKIDAGAFSFSTIETVVIESGVEEIETWAFGDSKIKEIYFPDYITSLHAGILDTEEGLEDLKIHCKPGSQVEKYFKDNPPDGKYEIVE